MVIWILNRSHHLFVRVYPPVKANSIVGVLREVKKETIALTLCENSRYFGGTSSQIVGAHGVVDLDSVCLGEC